MGGIARGAMNVLGMTEEALRDAPLATTALGASIAKPIAGGALGFLESLDLTGEQGVTENLDRRRREDAQSMIEARQRRLKELRMQNLARLAANMPDLYQSAAAGRRLPRGAVMIGGRPRVDILAQLADSMGAGSL